jgi:hypothetical protein
VAETEVVETGALRQSRESPNAKNVADRSQSAAAYAGGRAAYLAPTQHTVEQGALGFSVPRFYRGIRVSFC